jgi:hypothetical protein
MSKGFYLEPKLLGTSQGSNRQNSPLFPASICKLMTRIVQLAVVLAIASVVLITILPLPHLQGPRTATEGPVTTFLSVRLFLLLLLSIQATGKLVAGHCCPLSASPRTAKLSVLSSVLLC